MAEQAQQDPQDPRLQTGPTPPDRIYEAQARFVRGYITDFGGRTQYNPDGKNFRDFTAADFSRLPDRDLSTIRAIFIEENYDLIDQIKPTRMSRAEFSRGILREAARRGEAMNYYEFRMPFGVENVTVARPQEAPPERRVNLTESPAFITARDTAVGILRNRNLGSVNVQPDVAAQVGLRPDAQGRLPGFGIPTDTAAYDLGYTMGAVPQNRPNGSAPLELLFDQGPEQITYGYCAATNDIYAQRGRVIDQQEAFSAGWMQGRQDARSDFNPTDVRIGVLGSVCPVSTPPVNDNVRLMLALRSSSDGRSAN